MSDAKHPIRWPRAIAAWLGVYLAAIAIGVTLEILVLIPIGAPWFIRWLIGLAFAAVALFVVLPRLHPWYRPAPKVPQWTEDKL